MKDLEKVVFTLPTDIMEAVCALLTEQGRGVEQRDSETTPSIETGTVEVVIWLAGSELKRRVEEVETLLDSLRDMGQKVDPWSWVSEEVDSEAWEETYKQYFKVTRIGRHFVVRPSWEKIVPEPADLVINMNPGMAFGTGLHASTQLVVHAIERIAHNGLAPRRVLDLGCGTGILAIATARLWPSCQIRAVDKDDIAINVSRENLQLNGLESRIVLENKAGSEVSGTHGLVLANLSAEILTDLQPKMRKLTEDLGYLVLSGITVDQASELAMLYCRKLEFEPEYSEALDGWMMYLLKARD